MQTVDDIACFEVFLRVAQTGNMASTAQELGLSKSAVSRRIASLEKKLGTLFIRETNGVCLTSRGIALQARVESLLTRFEQLSTPAVHDDTGAMRGTIRVSAPSSIGNGLLIPWIKLFQDEHPEVMIDLTLTLGPVRMMPLGCDIRISHGLFPCERVITRPLGDMLRMMVASPDYLATHGMPKRPEELASHFLLGGNDLLDGMPLIVRSGQEHIVVPYLPRLRLRDHAAARSAALAGAGIACHAFKYDTIDFVRRGQLIHILPEWIPEPTPVSMLLPATRPISLIAQKLADFFEAKWHSHPYLASSAKGEIR